MVQLLPHLSFEFRSDCISMELVKGEEQLEGKKKDDLASLIMKHLTACGCDPSNFDFDVFCPAYGGNKIPTYGAAALPIVMNGSDQGPFEFLITDVAQQILGSHACLDLMLFPLHSPSFLCHAAEECNGKMESFKLRFEIWHIKSSAVSFDHGRLARKTLYANELYSDENRSSQYGSEWNY
ncbi:unnamed protein product [Lepeophtheirus salmonis]|uniref:(salmon louse) hypothetical protein n=1 Tax=Lepeophtheirus salmonis TaxID=72036 RepID=A0A7R8CX71_LEPSM|nr:unnamed protein product [Lepeophtheirus salmonis]CAF2957735.1 unnamed protein product [Lepeophtheirus salmonis]